MKPEAGLRCRDKQLYRHFQIGVSFSAFILSVNGIGAKFRPKLWNIEIANCMCVTFDGKSDLRPCHCRRLLYHAQQDVKMLIIVWKSNGTQSWRLLSFLFLRFSLSLPYSMFVPFLYFALIYPHSALLVVDNWSVVDDLISRREAYSFICFVFVIFFPPNFLCGGLFFHSCSSGPKKKLFELPFSINQPFRLQEDEITNSQHTR
jgi:hypothetical protein